MRNPNTNRFGASFTSLEIWLVWNKANLALGFNPQQFRRDACGALIEFSEYGKTTMNGWEIDHIKPVAKGGGDDLDNLQPLWWSNNRYKADDWPYWACRVSA